MNTPISPKLLQIFLPLLQARRWIIAAFAVLAAAGIYGAAHIPTDSAIERLVVAGDPVAQATLDFERVFPEEEQALLMLEAPDPYRPDVLQGAERLEGELNKIPHVAARSVLTLYRRAGSSEIAGSDAAGLRAFATNTHPVPPRRPGGRTLPRHCARTASQLQRRSGPRTGSHRRTGAAHRKDRASLHRHPAGRHALARRLARTANRRRHEEIHASLRDFSVDAGGDRVPLVAHPRRHRSHSRRRRRHGGGTGRPLRLDPYHRLDHRAAHRHGHDHRHAGLHSFPLHGAGRLGHAPRTSGAGARE